jgi:hypothetical protein
MFTLVRHSAFAQAANPEYEDAVEVAEVDHAQSYRVKAAGGLLFATRADAEAAPAKDKPAVKKAVKKAPEPMHTHALDGETHEACDPCQSHGNPLNFTETAEFEEVPKVAATGPVKAPSVADRLAALLEDADSDASESDAESDAAGGLSEEEFEDDE